MSNFALENIFHLSVSELMESEREQVMRLTKTLVEQLSSLDVDTWEMETYIDWSGNIARWCENLQSIVSALESLQMTVAKKRANISDDRKMDVMDVSMHSD